MGLVQHSCFQQITSTSRHASIMRAYCSLLMTNPFMTFFTTIGDCPIIRISSRVTVVTWGAVQGAGITSTRGTRWGGFIGWDMIQLWRCVRCSVNFDGSIQEEELARMVASSTHSSSSLKTLVFKASFSKTLSCRTGKENIF